MRDLLNRIERIPMWARVTILALAAAATVIAGVVVQKGDSEPKGGVAGAKAQSAYLGPRSAGGWVRSRPKLNSVIWAIGDGADGGSESQAVASMVGSRRVDRLLYLGDVYESGTAQQFQANYDPAYHRFDGITAPTIGNHEWPNVATGYVPYWTAARGTPPPVWYTFAASGWQLISLNSNAPTSPDQLDWLRDTISQTPRFGNCRIAFMHHPRFSAGLHGDLSALQGIFSELQGHASILLAGHDHDMERLHPVNGITQYVDGAGGKELYPVNSSDPRLAFADNTHHGALRIRLIPGQATLTFVAEDGTTLDRSFVGCRQRPA
jgi:Calcineurin-like phosphoesterase